MNKKANILLVDDEPGMLRYIRTLLEVDDHHVETAATGEAALEHRAERPASRPGAAGSAHARNRRHGNSGATCASCSPE